MQSLLHKIVIVGGGAGGIELATHLGKRLGFKRLARPVLLDANPTHIWKPLLHEVATGALNTGEDEVNYFSHGHKNGYEFELGRMSGLDRNRRLIQIAPILDENNKQVIRQREISYDTLCIAVGAITNDFGISGVGENCIFLNTPMDAEYLRKKILIEAFKVVTGDSGENLLRIGIVGGGATGVELAAEIHHTICSLRNYGANLFQDQLQITIMEGSERILGGAPLSLSKFATNELTNRHIDVKTNCIIKSVTPEGFQLSDGSILKADIKVWTAGIKAPDWLGTLGLKTNKINQIQTNGFLQTEDDSKIYAFGDCAQCPDNSSSKSSKYLPATAQVAHQQAEYLAEKLVAHLSNRKVKPFEFEPKGMLVSLGEAKAVGSLAALVGPKRDYYVEGRGAKILYASLYRMHQAVLYGWTRAGLLWIGDKLRHVALPQLKLH